MSSTVTEDQLPVTMAESDSMKPTADERHHFDLYGNPFTIPTFNMKEIHAAIPSHCFRSSAIRSSAYVLRDICYLTILTTLSLNLIPLLPSSTLRFLSWALATFLISLPGVGIWILAHECGHGSFSPSRRLNHAIGLILHSFLLVPFHSWRLTHSQHHKATGNMEKDTVFVPHVRESWIKRRFGEKADMKAKELAEMTEDALIVSLWWAFIHQTVGWPGYLLCNLTGQSYGGAKGVRISHFWFGEDSVFFKKEDLGLIALSDVGILTTIAGLVAAGWKWGAWYPLVLWGVPWLWVNCWIVAITFLQHTDGLLPHYSSSTWTFPLGATATIDRDLGILDTHFFHKIISTHVCHHLISTIPFYHADEASIHIRRVMGEHYKRDGETPFWTAFWRNQRNCKFVEESEGMEGKGVWFYRNLWGKEGQAKARDLTSPASQTMVVDEETEKDLVKGMSKIVDVLPNGLSSPRKSLDGSRRRLSHSAQLKANLPLLSEA